MEIARGAILIELHTLPLNSSLRRRLVIFSHMLERHSHFFDRTSFISHLFLAGLVSTIEPQTKERSHPLFGTRAYSPGECTLNAAINPSYELVENNQTVIICVCF